MRFPRFLLVALPFVNIAAGHAADTPKSKAPKAPAPAAASAAKKVELPIRPPTLANVVYGAHERQVLDFWKADSPRPTPLLFHIHGGGWVTGDKARVANLDAYLAAGISVVSINYRYVTQAITAGVQPPVQWPLQDAARALQFVRSKAREWNLDSARIGASGGSAGACSSLWLAFRDDLADPHSADPIARESTRLWCAAVSGAQTTLDPAQMQAWTPNSRYGGHAFGFMPDVNNLKTRDTQFAEFLAARGRILPWIRQYSPFEHVSADDPPIYLTYAAPPALGQEQKDPTHTANFGVKLQEKLRSVGVPCELVYPGAPEVEHLQMHDYLIDVLKRPGSARGGRSAPPGFTASMAHVVTGFGATGDGRADDTAAVQRAIDGGGGVHFPTGTYRLTRTIAIDLDRTGFVSLTADGTARVIMAGPGPAFEFVGTHGGSAAPAQFKPNVWERQRSPRVDGLEIVGAHPEADGIAAKGTMQLTVNRVIVREARHAIRLYERNRNVLISDCHLYHNRGVGVFLDAVNLHQINLTGSHISYNAGGGVVARGGNLRNLHIGNCDIESNMSAETPSTANVLIDCTGGSIGEVAITGCTIQHNPAGPDSANVRFIGAGEDPATARAPARPTREGHLTITGNIFSDVQVNVHLVKARGVTLTGNTFWMGFQHDLLVEDSSNVVVGPNNLDRNPRYDSQARPSRGGVVFRRSQDCTVTGLHVNGVRQHAAAVVVEDCGRMNLTNGTVLDSDGVGLQVRNTTLSRISGWLIRDGRPEPNAAPALVVAGGRGNVVTENVLDRSARLDPVAGVFRNNEVVRDGAR